MVSFTFEQQSVRAGMIFSIMLSFMLGLFVGKSLARCSKVNNVALTSSDAPLNYGEMISEKDISSVSDKLSEFSSQKFACNTQLAIEHLTQLHVKRVKLEEHRKRGDANRARIATIDRKANAAVAAEGAFRVCVSEMMPEVLEYWDEKNKKNQLSKRQWDEKNEVAIDGITFSVLQQTAAELENALSDQA